MRLPRDRLRLDATDTVRRRSRLLPRPALAAVTLLAAVPCASAGAQWVTGLGEDAVVLPRGMVRVNVSGAFTSYDERFSSTTDGTPSSDRRGLGSDLSVASLDATVLPGLADTDALLRVLAGPAAPSVTFGRLAVSADARRAELPVRIEVGIGSRLQLSVAAAYVETRVAVGVEGDPTAREGNLGIDPALADAAIAGANAALAEQLRAAAEALDAQLAQCGAGGAPACARPAEAAALRTDLAAAAGGVEGIYYTGDPGGIGFVPVAGSALAGAIAERLAALASATREYGITTIPLDASPRHASAPLSPGALLALTDVGAPALGLPALRESSRYGMSDMEIGAKFRLLDQLDGRIGIADSVRGTRIRASISALVRLGTGRVDDPVNPLDLGVGDGQTDVEVGVAADVLTGRRLITSIAARYGIQLEDELDRAVPRTAADVLLTASDVRAVRRNLGDYVELEVTPRYALNDYLSLGAHYRFRSKGADAYELSDAQLATDPRQVDVSLLGLGTETRQHVAGVGIVLSTLGAYARGTARWPVDISFRRTTTFAGAGRLAERATRDDLTLRVYLDVFGGR